MRKAGLPVLIWLLAFQAYAAATPVLHVTPITWDVIGLDSNNPNTGPDTFPVGARVCNVGTSAATGVSAQFVFEGGTTNAHIRLIGLSRVTLDNLPSGSTPSHPNRISSVPANCQDAYFNVQINRSASAYSSRVSTTATPSQRNTQLYRIDVTATGVGPVSTPTPRELYVEKLVSQNRNAVVSFTGPSTVSVGQVVQFTLRAKTATGGYEQLENFPVLPNSVYQVLNVTTSYTAPTGAVNSSVYGDACGWENNRTSVNYHNNSSCIGPANYTGGKVGGDMSSTYTVRIISGGTAGVYNLIYDYSGSSYHYNSDYGTAGNGFMVTATAPDLTLSKTHAGDFTVGQPGSFTFTVRTADADVYGTTTIRDTLPTGLSLPDGPVGLSGTNASSWRCSSLSNVVTCTSTNTDTPGMPNTPLFKVGESSTFTINGIVVGPAAAPAVTNTATVSNPNERPDATTNNSASDPVTVLAADLNLTKTSASSYSIPSLPGDPAATPPTTATIHLITYTLRVSNIGSAASSGTVTVTDTLPAGLTATSISGSGWTCAAPPTLTCTRADALPAGSSYPPLTLTVQSPFTTELERTPSLRNFTNVAAVSGGNEVNTANNQGSATLRMVYAKLAKRVRNVSTGSAFATTSTGTPGQTLEYCMDFVNYSGFALENFRVLDHVPGNTTALMTGYDSEKPASLTGAGYGIRLTRNTAVTYLTSAADTTDRGSLSTSAGSFGAGVMDTTLPTTLALDETGSVCFRATIR